MAKLLREAADRVRQWLTAQQQNRNFGTFPAPMVKAREVSKAESVLAEAYLAEHLADDDEPTSRMWLLEVGFLSPNENPHLLDIAIDEHTGWHLFLRIHAVHFEAQVMQCRVGCEAEGLALTKTSVRTRGDVRRLCKALGIPLTT